jgi:hypothetical protein
MFMTASPSFKRPVTIKQIIVSSLDEGWVGFTVLGKDDKEKLPLKLTYGDKCTFLLTEEVAHGVWDQEYVLYVIDAEGNKYRPTLKREFSPRYDRYTEFQKIKYKNRKRY